MLLRLAAVALALALPARTMSVILGPAVAESQSAGGYVTTLMPGFVSQQNPGSSSGIAALCQQDYPSLVYLNAGVPAEGTLFISKLSAFQNGLQGGTNISAAFSPASGTHAPNL